MMFVGKNLRRRIYSESRESGNDIDQERETERKNNRSESLDREIKSQAQELTQASERRTERMTQHPLTQTKHTEKATKRERDGENR